MCPSFPVSSVCLGSSDQGLRHKNGDSTRQGVSIQGRTVFYMDGLKKIYHETLICKSKFWQQKKQTIDTTLVEWCFEKK